MMSTPVTVYQWSWLLSGSGQCLAGQTAGRGEWAGLETTLFPAVSSLTLHFLPTHTLTGTAAITARRLQEHKIWLISLTNQPTSPIHASVGSSH